VARSALAPAGSISPSFRDLSLLVSSIASLCRVRLSQLHDKMSRMMGLKEGPPPLTARILKNFFP
jgi:hypothetical protein